MKYTVLEMDEKGVFEKIPVTVTICPECGSFCPGTLTQHFCMCQLEDNLDHSPEWVTKELLNTRIAEMTPQQLRLFIRALWIGRSWFNSLEIAMCFAEEEVI